jgi:PAS domain S-box-containing protein
LREYGKVENASSSYLAHESTTLQAVSNRSDDPAGSRPAARKRYVLITVVLGVAIAGLYILSRHNYPLFHSLADGITALIAAGVFVLVWNRRRLLDNDYYLFIGIAFLFFAFWDFLHLLGNQGMGVFPQYGNMGPTLYIVSRYFLGISMLAAPLFIRRKLNLGATFAAYSVATVLLIFSVFYWRNFPVTYIAGVGLTPFKVISDYLICGILLVSLVLLAANRRALDARVFRLATYAFILFIATGLAFTTYTDPFGVTNALGHFFQIASFYLVYAAFVETVVVRPQDILYRNVKESEEKYRNLFNNMAEEVHFWKLERDQNGKIKTWRLVDANPPTLETWGRQTVEEIRGRTADEILGPGSTEHYMPVVQKVMTEGLPSSYDDYFPNLNRYFRFTTVPFGDYFITTGADITAIRQAAEALKETEERFRALSETSPIGVGISSADGVLQYTNPSYESILGYSHGELVGKKAAGLYWSPEERLSWLDRIKENGVVRDVEIRLRKKDGTPIWVSIAASLINYGGKQAVMGTIQDITNRKRVETEITNLASFTELNPNPIVEVDASGNIIYANPAAKKCFNDLLALGSKHPFMAGVAEMIEKGERNAITDDIEVDGRWYERTLAYAPFSQSYRLYGRDITGRKNAEESFRETLNYLDNLFNYANAPIIVWNPKFEITRFNHAFEELTGRRAEEVFGKGLDILFPDDSRDMSIDYIRKTAAERWEVKEIPILRKDGTVRIVLWNSATLYAPDGKTPTATIAQGQDITERKHAEEELRRSNAELEASNRELEAFSYSVSHDLRAPLRSMEGFSSALIEDYAEKLDEQGKKYLNYVQESSETMARLIDDLLKLSRVTRSEMNYQKVNLSELAGKIVSELERNEPNRRVELKIAPNITGYGDHNLLRLALENLLGNAWKFSGKVESPRIEFGTTRHNGGQAYFVRDNGAGFDTAYAGNLFKPFQRLHKASEFTGTGIGLATVQRIVRRHGGEVWAESKPGEGATFYFTLG